MSTLADRLKLLRTTLGYNQNKFSKAIGMPTSSLWHLERGRVLTDNKRLQPIITQFGVNKKWLFEGKGEMFKEAAKKEEQTELLLESPIQEEEKYMLSGRELGLLLSVGDMDKEKREKIINHFRSYLEIQKMMKQEAK